MATDESKVSPIGMPVDDDDEFVIHAGVQTQATNRASSAGVKPTERAASSQSATLPTAAPEDALQESSNPSAVKESRDKGYHETTAEDIEVGPMSTTQKTVIAVSLLVVVGFLAYFMFSMR